MTKDISFTWKNIYGTILVAKEFGSSSESFRWWEDLIFHA